VCVVCCVCVCVCVCVWVVCVYVGMMNERTTSLLLAPTLSPLWPFHLLFSSQVGISIRSFCIVAQGQENMHGALVNSDHTSSLTFLEPMEMPVLVARGMVDIGTEDEGEVADAE